MRAAEAATSALCPPTATLAPASPAAAMAALPAPLETAASTAAVAASAAATAAAVALRSWLDGEDGVGSQLREWIGVMLEAQLNGDMQRRHPAAEAAVVLLSKNLRWGHHCPLPSSLNGPQQRSHSNDRLAAADISLNQSSHRFLAVQI
mgnify:CR=1 FL=1